MGEITAQLQTVSGVPQRTDLESGAKILLDHAKANQLWPEVAQHAAEGRARVAAAFQRAQDMTLQEGMDTDEIKRLLDESVAHNAPAEEKGMSPVYKSMLHKTLYDEIRRKDDTFRQWILKENMTFTDALKQVLGRDYNVGGSLLRAYTFRTEDMEQELVRFFESFQTYGTGVKIFFEGQDDIEVQYKGGESLSITFPRSREYNLEDIIELMVAKGLYCRPDSSIFLRFFTGNRGGVSIRTIDDFYRTLELVCKRGAKDTLQEPLSMQAQTIRSELADILDGLPSMDFRRAPRVKGELEKCYVRDSNRPIDMCKPERVTHSVMQKYIRAGGIRKMWIQVLEYLQHGPVNMKRLTEEPDEHCQGVYVVYELADFYQHVGRTLYTAATSVSDRDVAWEMMILGYALASFANSKIPSVEAYLASKEVGVRNMTPADFASVIQLVRELPDQATEASALIRKLTELNAAHAEIDAALVDGSYALKKDL